MCTVGTCRLCLSVGVVLFCFVYVYMCCLYVMLCGCRSEYVFVIARCACHVVLRAYVRVSRLIIALLCVLWYGHSPVYGFCLVLTCVVIDMVVYSEFYVRYVLFNVSSELL